MANESADLPQTIHNTAAESNADGGTPSFNFGTYTASGSQTSNFIGAIHAKNLTISSPRDEDTRKKRKDPEPDSTIPFGRNLKFVGREGAFDKLHAIYEQGHARAVVYGLGGIGKSQIAIEYAFRRQEQEEFKNTWVFWMSAVSVDALVQSFRTIVETLELPGCKEPTADVLSMAERWLTNKSNGPWFMIVDNADDGYILHQPYKLPGSNQTRSLFSYIPQKAHGRVLVTTRDRDTAYEAVQDYDLLIKLDFMNMEESLALLRSRVPFKPSEEETHARELVDVLGYIPLAISQAGAYIRRMGSQISISDYLTEFKANESNKVALLNRQKIEHGRDRDVPNSILITWTISFEKLRVKNREAANLLCLMSMLHRQSIPLGLIRVTDKNSTQESITLLEDHCFITVTRPSKPVLSEDERLFSLHRLIQLATVQWLEANSELNEWRTRALRRVSEVFPHSASYQDWGSCEILLLHAEEVLSHTAMTQDQEVLARGLLYISLAKYDISRGRYSLSLERAIISVRMNEEHREQTGNGLVDAMATMAEAYYLLRQWDKAENLLLRAIEKQNSIPKVDELRMAGLTGFLALVYGDQGRFYEAEQILDRNLDIQKMELGSDHPEVRQTMLEIARNYYLQGQLDKAKELYAQIIETDKLKLNDHPDTLSAMCNLGQAFSAQRRIDEAKQLFVQTIETEKTTLGTSYPATFAAMQSLGSIYTKQEQYDKAKDLYTRVLAIQEAKLGVDHPDSLTTMHSLAYTYEVQGRLDLAEKLYKQVLETRISKLTINHPHTLKTMSSLAALYDEQDRLEAAEELYRQLLATRIKELGSDHVDTQLTAHNLAYVYDRQGKHYEAEQLYTHIINIRKTNLNASHSQVLLTMHNFAWNHWNSGRTNEAVALMEEVVQLMIETLGEEDEDTIRSRKALSTLRQEAAGSSSTVID